MNPTTTSTPLASRIHERLAQSRGLSLSLIIHCIIVAVFGTAVIVTQVAQQEDFQPTGSLVDVATLVHEPAPDDEPRPPDVGALPNPQVAPPTSTADIVAIATTHAKPTFQIRANINVDVKMPALETSISSVTSQITGTANSMMGGRFTKGPGGRILGTGNGKPAPTEKTELAVLRGLNWLRDHQNPDGSWGESSRGAMTGLALLCFLGHGETGASKNYGLAVNRAVQWMLDEGTASQARLSMSRSGWGGNAGVYEHAIGTYALGEYYTMSVLTGAPDERVIELLRAATRHILEGQGPDGGWMYSYDKTQSDTSVSGWQVQALKAVHLTKLELPGLNTALDRAMLNFDRVQTPEGGYGYRRAENRWSLTGVGVLSEMFWRQRRDGTTRKAVEFILEKTREQPVQYQHEKADLYAWYYHTQALLMFGGPAWTRWEKMFSDELVKSQATDGSWPAMKAAAHGNLQTTSALTGAVYRTTLSVLMLESYYRYLPANR